MKHEAYVYLATFLLSISLFVSCASDRGKDIAAKTESPPGSSAPGMNSPTGGQSLKTISPVGYIDRADCNALSGWVLNKDRPEEPLQLELYADDKLQGKLQASAVFRKDLLDAKIGTGKYGFLYPIPQNLKDGKPHAIKLKAQGSDYELEFWLNTPRFISCKPD